MPTMRPPSAQTQTRRGFTLVELMVAVLVGSIVLVGVYTIYSVSVRGYRVQDQAVQAIGQLRTAMHQLKSDLRSAAFNAPAQSEVETWVRVVGAPPLAAVAIDVDPQTPVAHAGVNTAIAPQRLRLLGDYDSHRVWTTVRIEGTIVTLQWNPEHGGQAEFERIFNSERFLRIEMYGEARQEQYIPIASTKWDVNAPQVTVASQVLDVKGYGAGHEVTVASYIRYRLVRDTRRNDASVKYDLIRERLDTQGQPIAGSWLVVAENIVDMQFYDLCFNITAPELGTMRQTPVDLRCYPNLAAVPEAYSLAPDDDNQSHLLRSVTVKIAARTPYEDPEVPFAPRPTIDQPLNAFEVDPETEGAARVFEGAATVFLTSVQARRQ